MKNYTYNFNPQGQLLARHELLGGLNLRDTFVYDNLNRLNRFNTADTVNYTPDNYGNISYKSGMGSFVYGAYGVSPYALTSITGASQVMLNDSLQDVTYNAFDKVDSISQQVIHGVLKPKLYAMKFYYGSDHQRYKTILNQTDSATITKYILFGNFERIVKNGVTTERCYVSGGEGVCAVVEKKNNANKTYYIHKDNLGSWNVISDSIGNIVQRVSLDAWGRRRNAFNWTYTSTGDQYFNQTLRFDRGYTGHEHIQAFNLINMNGRMYDPAVGRFLSPDIFADAGSTQGMNSYSYCNNNPLMFTDPSGWIAAPNDGYRGVYQGTGSFVVPGWDALGLFSTDIGGAGGAGSFGNGCGQSFGDVAGGSYGGNGLNSSDGIGDQGWGGRGPDIHLGGYCVVGKDGKCYGSEYYAKLIQNNTTNYGGGANGLNNAVDYLNKQAQQKQQQQFEDQQKLLAARNIGYGDMYYGDDDSYSERGDWIHIENGLDLKVLKYDNLIPNYYQDHYELVLGVYGNKYSDYNWVQLVYWEGKLVKDGQNNNGFYYFDSDKPFITGYDIPGANYYFEDRPNAKSFYAYLTLCGKTGNQWEPIATFTWGYNTNGYNSIYFNQINSVPSEQLKYVNSTLKYFNHP